MRKFSEYDIDLALTEYADHLERDYETWLSRITANADGGSESSRRLRVNFNPGSKFFKVVVNDSAHSFVCRVAHDKWKVGDILKAASWAAPAKNFPRGNVLEGDIKSTRWSGV